MGELHEYKCPQCGGALEFDSTLQKMKCPFCDGVFDMDAYAAVDEDLLNGEEYSWDTDSGQEWSHGETDGMRVYICQSCGGEIIGDEHLAAGSCPYCGNRIVMMGNFSGALKPDLVIPFQVDKEAAKAAYHRHIQGKKLLPRVFASENYIDEIKGIYVPFWLFDAEAKADIRYHGTIVRSWSDRNYDYTETSHYAINRAGHLGFRAIPVDGSSKMADDLMESLEPYDVSKAVDFKTAYLAGYFADKYDVDAEHSVERANERIRRSAEETMASTVHGFATVTPEQSYVKVEEGRIRYALYPVWLLSTTWNGEKYTFAMNGQTGKFVGDLPVDAKLYRKYFGITALIGAIATYAIATIVHFL